MLSARSCSPYVMKIFWPVIRHEPSSAGTARGRQRADVGAGLRLGQVHRPGPLAGDHLGDVDLALRLAAVVQQHVDGALGQQRAQRERHVGRRHDLLHGHADEPREPSPAVLGRERHGRPAGLDVALVGLGEAVGRRDGAVVVAPAVLQVADPVERGELLGEEPARLVEDAADRRPGRRARSPAARPARRCRRRAGARSACPPTAACTQSMPLNATSAGGGVDEGVEPERAARGGGRPSSSGRRGSSRVGPSATTRPVVEDHRARAQLQRVGQVVGHERAS